MGILGLNRLKKVSGADLFRNPERISPRSVGFVAGLIAIVFVVLRLFIAAEGDVSRFIVAGNAATNPAQVEPKIHVFDSYGYDGQFYWRLATNPAELELEPYRGVQLDSPMRVSRIAYPTVAWSASLGQASLVKWSLVLTNVLGFAALATVAAALARRHGRSALVGLAVASSSGLVMALARDLTEVIMVASLIGGIALLSSRRYELAAACWVVACLAHEQALLIVIPYFTYRVVQMIRTRTLALAAPDLPWIVAGAAFGVWQIVCRAAIGSFPMMESGNATLDVPFRGFIRQVMHWVDHGLDRQQLLVVPQLALLIVLVVLAFRSVASLQEEDRWLRWALIGATALAVSLSKAVWVGPAELRQFVVLSTIAWLIIVAARRQIPIALFLATGTVWLATAALRTAAI